MRRVFLLALALALVLGGIAFMLPRLHEAAMLNRLIEVARNSPEPVRHGRWVVLGPRFTGRTTIDSARNIRVEVRPDRLVKLQYGFPGKRGEISDYPTRPSANLPWRVEGARLD